MAAGRAEVADGPVYMPVEQYLALDEATDGKYEYLDGFVFMLRPDVTVSCGQEAGSMLANPIVVVEVLSPATERRDRGAKFKAYKALPSVQEYMLIGSEYKAIEVHRREGNFWRQYYYRAGDLVELASIGVSFPFDDVYRRINLE